MEDYYNLSDSLEFASSGMGWSAVLADVSMFIDYEADGDYLMMGFFAGQTALGSPILAAENYNFFAELWGLKPIHIERFIG